MAVEKKEVSPEDYSRILERHKDDVYNTSFLGWQLPILHGLIALAADHPDIEKTGWPTKAVIQQVRRWCRQKFCEWGFSPEEVEYLDTMRER